MELQPFLRKRASLIPIFCGMAVLSRDFVLVAVASGASLVSIR